eukprot:jgi/Botrbrau1/12327/Bobra.4_3s0001.1
MGPASKPSRATVLLYCACTSFPAVHRSFLEGADGLIKLWAVRTTECTATFDGHEGKVWALAVAGESESLLASGGADARLQVWEDCTAADMAAAQQALTQAVQKQQLLSNALQAEDYETAARLALEMGQPGRLLGVVDAVRVRGPEAAQPVLASLAAGLEPAQLKQCLEYIREWNTNSRHCHAAQALLQAIFLQRPPAELLKMSGVGELVEGLLSYSQRHAARLDRLIRSTHLLDYTLAACQVLQATAADAVALQGERTGPPGEAPSGLATPDLSTESNLKGRPRSRTNGRGAYPRENAESSSTTDSSDGDPDEAMPDVGAPDQASFPRPHAHVAGRHAGGLSSGRSAREAAAGPQGNERGVAETQGEDLEPGRTSATVPHSGGRGKARGRAAPAEAGAVHGAAVQSRSVGDRGVVAASEIKASLRDGEEIEEVGVELEGDNDEGLLSPEDAGVNDGEGMGVGGRTEEMPLGAEGPGVTARDSGEPGGEAASGEGGPGSLPQPLAGRPLLRHLVLGDPSPSGDTREGAWGRGGPAGAPVTWFHRGPCG